MVDEAKACGQAGVVEGANEVVASFLTFITGAVSARSQRCELPVCGLRAAEHIGLARDDAELEALKACAAAAVPH